jgi:hypothetical protein
MHAVSALLLLLLPLVFGQDENLPQGPCDLTTDECVEVIDGSACYNSAIQAGNLTALMSCYPGGEKQVLPPERASLGCSSC